MVAFPDFSFEEHCLHHTQDAVIVETTFHGIHNGPWRGLPATGKKVAYRMCNVFVFEEDRLVCERLYFDLMSILRQLGLARDPLSLMGRIEAVLAHPMTIASAALKSLTGMISNKREK